MSDAAPKLFAIVSTNVVMWQGKGLANLAFLVRPNAHNLQPVCGIVRGSDLVPWF